MRWSVIRLIFGKELRDLLRDRRTVMLILVLPALLYPLFGLTGFVFASALIAQPAVVGVIGQENLPKTEWPKLLEDGLFARTLEDADVTAAPLGVKFVEGDPEALIRSREVDLVLVIPKDLEAKIAKHGELPVLKVHAREGDDKAKLAAKRLNGILIGWEDLLRAKRFRDAKLPEDFDRVINVEDPQSDKPKAKKAADELRDSFVKVFPFILMMWLVAGAIQPAVDMTAGEKERGTMETLLISPASRSEIVFGKFFATTTFSFTSVVWNVVWFTGAGLAIEALLKFPIVNIPGLLACLILGLPLAMFFSAVCLALGVFARSTKEGQYYLMPLILFTMPLAFWSMMPGSTLTAGTCLIPITGAMLFQQRLLSTTGDPIPWEYFLPTMLALAFWVGLALYLAIYQFKREEVLFRETGGDKPSLWSRLFGKAPVEEQQ
jgi:sodium transport system permease protein